MRDPLTRTTGIALLGSVTLMPLLVLPIMVGIFVDDLGVGEDLAGWLASSGFLGAACTALVLAFRMHHLDLRRTALIGLVVLLVLDITSIAGPALPVVALAAIRLLSGAAGAAAYASVMATFAGWQHPDRAYGYFMALQFAVSAAGLFLLPALAPRLGVSGLFALFAVLDLCALALVRLIPTRGERDARLPPLKLEWKVIFAAASVLCLLAVGLFETSQMAQFTYIERFGLSLGLEGGDIGKALGLSSVMGIPAAFAVSWLGDRFGYFRPIALACLAQVAAVFLLTQVDAFTPYLVLVCVFAMGWAFVLPYFQAIAARIDPGGSVVVACGFATGTAGFLGPAGAALLVGQGEYSKVLLTVGLSLCVVIALTWWVAAHSRTPVAVDP